METTHHIFEDRRRAYLCQRYDENMTEFNDQLARLCSRYKRRTLLGELKHGLDVGKDGFSKSWTKVEWRLDHDGRSVDRGRLPTITSQLLVLHVDGSTTPPTVEEVHYQPGDRAQAPVRRRRPSVRVSREGRKGLRTTWAWACRSSWGPPRGGAFRGVF